jgi:hypothetical protein
MELSEVDALRGAIAENQRLSNVANMQLDSISATFSEPFVPLTAQEVESGMRRDRPQSYTITINRGDPLFSRLEALIAPKLTERATQVSTELATRQDAVASDIAASRTNP